MADTILDVSILLEMLADDRELATAVLKQFADSAESYLQELEEAIEAQNAKAVQSLGHKLKSSSRTIGAERLGDICEKLEKVASKSNWPLISTAQRSLKQELVLVLEVIDEAIDEA